ncbi:MAG: hypothetical protein ACTSWR_06025 [Candidatus Helarchaeota archaeon]
MTKKEQEILKKLNKIINNYHKKFDALLHTTLQKLIQIEKKIK